MLISMRGTIGRSTGAIVAISFAVAVSGSALARPSATTLSPNGAQSGVAESARPDAGSDRGEFKVAITRCELIKYFIAGVQICEKIYELGKWIQKCRQQPGHWETKQVCKDVPEPPSVQPHFPKPMTPGTSPVQQ